MAVNVKYVVAAIVVVVVVVAGVSAYVLFVPPAPETIKIGAIGPLSAPGAYESGIFMRNAMQLAVDDVNAAGGVLDKDLELIYEDTAATPEKGVAAANKLILEDRVVALTGEYHSSVCNAVNEVAEANEIPFLVTECWADVITEEGHDYTFRLAPYNSYMADIVWVGFVDYFNFTNVVMLVEDTDWGTGLRNVLEPRLEALGISVTAQVVDRTRTDFTSELTSFQAMTPKPDLLMDIMTGAAEKIIINQAYEIGLAPDCFIISADGDPAYPEWWGVVEDNGVTVVFPTMYSPKVQLTDVGEKFRTDYFNRHGREPEYVAMEGYDSILVLADAIERAGSTDPTKIAEALRTASVKGTRATITFSVDSADKGVNARWQQWLDVPVYLLQYQAKGLSQAEADVVYPLQFKTAELMYPGP